MVVIRKKSADLKSSLIDLEAQKWATGANRKDAERLSEKTRKGCDSLSIGITKEAYEES